MVVKTTKWDIQDYLKTPEEISAYLDAVLEDGDSALIQAAIGEVAKAAGMSMLARETGLAREGLYKSLSSEGNPSFSTIIKVLKALGLELHVSPREHQHA